jgi:hypothetical protein
MERITLDRVSSGASIVVSTASGSTYTFTVSGPRYGTLDGGRLEEPTLALFIGAQSDDHDAVEIDPGAIEVGRRVRFLCPLVGEIVTTAVTSIALETHR